MAKKQDGARKPGAKTWEQRKGPFAGTQLFREDVQRIKVLAGAVIDPETNRPMSHAVWFRSALGPTLAELYESYVRSLAQPGRRPSDPPRAATG